MKSTGQKTQKIQKMNEETNEVSQEQLVLGQIKNMFLIFSSKLEYMMDIRGDLLLCTDKNGRIEKMIYIWRKHNFSYCLDVSFYFYAVYFNNAETGICLLTFRRV